MARLNSIEKYLLSCYSAEGRTGLTFADAKSDSAKAINLRDIFVSEMGWEVEQKGAFKAAEHWFSGLCSACTVDYTYVDILATGIALGLIKENSRESTQYMFCEKWFGLCASNLLGIFRKFNLKVGK